MKSQCNWSQSKSNSTAITIWKRFFSLIASTIGYLYSPINTNSLLYYYQISIAIFLQNNYIMKLSHDNDSKYCTVSYRRDKLEIDAKYSPLEVTF